MLTHSVDPNWVGTESLTIGGEPVTLAAVDTEYAVQLPNGCLYIDPESDGETAIFGNFNDADAVVRELTERADELGVTHYSAWIMRRRRQVVVTGWDSAEEWATQSEQR